MSVCLHCFNWLQVIRLLATRGHYSIDLIIGYVVAVWVSSPAERLGLHYSLHLSPSLPGLVETFETLIGVSVSEVRINDHDQESPTRKQLQPGLHHADESKTAIKVSHSVRSETSVRIAMDILSDMAQRNYE
jgi:hypothetical protein